jgi:deazaflavin-dependent oxidoreductase (nitroreductase family)
VSGHRIGTARPGKGVGTLFLVSTGRKTGATRRNALFYIEDGSNFVVVASNAGAETDPAWWKNVQTTPDAAIELGRRTVPIRARRADPVETERLWPLLVAANPDYETYRATATRDIPVVILEARG